MTWQKFHHYCFTREVSIITDHKPLVAIFKKDVATLLQRLQQILLRIHQYRFKIICKPGSDLFIADWVSRQSHKEDKDEEIAGIQVNINTIETATNIPECMMIYELQHETATDNHLQQLKEFITKGWPEMKDNTVQNLRLYWKFQDNMAVIDRAILKDRHIVIPDTLQKQALEQLHINHMGVEKTKLLACESIYLPGSNSDIKKYIRNCFTHLEFQQILPKEQIIHYEIPRKPWGVVGADIFTLHKKYLSK